MAVANLPLDKVISTALRTTGSLGSKRRPMSPIEPPEAGPATETA